MRFSSRLFGISVWKSIVLALALLISAQNLSAGPTGPIAGKFIVKLTDRAQPDLMAKTLRSGEGIRKAFRFIPRDNVVGGEQFSRFFVFHTTNKAARESDVLDILGRENVEYVEPEYYIELFEFPTDSLFSNQWYLYNAGQEYWGVDRYYGEANDSLVLKSGIPGKDVRMTGYYNDPPADQTRVVVAVIDSGVDLVHPELQGKFWKNLDEIPGNFIDDDHNGYVDDTLGYDISGDIMTLFDVQGDDDPTDSIGHGTHIAGIITANVDSRGVAGLVPNALIMPIKILPNATTSVGAEGILYAVNAGAQVINISWGMPYESGVVKEVLDFARRNHVMVSISAGNSADDSKFYPASYDSSFAVAAGNSDGYVAYFSTYGPQVDIVAPGQDILSLRAAGTDMYGDNGEPGVHIIGDDSLYYLADGTSMAAPVVAAAAALIWSIRPDLSLAGLENLLRLGATDMLDPLNQGDTLLGPDSICGYGYIDIDNSLSMLFDQGLALISPIRQLRYTEDVVIKAIPIGGYAGAWTLEYAVGNGTVDWQYLASGTDLPVDSVLFILTDTTLEGQISLKLTDKYGAEYVTTFFHVRRNIINISTPVNGDSLKYDIRIKGSAYGPDYDSMTVFVIMDDSITQLTSRTGEYFDSVMYQWATSGVDPGPYTIIINGYFDDLVQADSVDITLASAFAVGWPKKLGGVGAISPVCADLNHDGFKEVIVGSGYGLYVFSYDGNPVEGFPALPGVDMRCVPAIYDVDRDGQDEIIATNADGIHVFKFDGSYAPGWPQECYTGSIPFNYNYPNPTVAKLGMGEDSAIVIVNTWGQILAYEFNGDSYFYSLEGLFASLDPRASDAYSLGGGSSPFVTSVDMNGDDLYEVLVSYTSPYPYTGVALFDGRTGQPAFDMADPLILRIPYVYGTTLADLTGDGRLEVITAGYCPLSIPGIWITTNLFDYLPGFPVAMPEVQSWIGSYPILADLDLDDSPEILISFFEFDISRLYIFKADGTPYAQMNGEPFGVAFSASANFGTPTVANLVGDLYPEIVFRSGYILPGTGQERLYMLDHEARPVPGWPIATPARTYEVVSAPFAPLVDDIDGDNLVELLLVSDNDDLLVWNFEASYDNGRNTGRFLRDNLNGNTWSKPESPTDVDDNTGLPPHTFALAQNYPNPFNPSTSISFQLPSAGDVKLEIFNILGQRVKTLIDQRLDAGQHTVAFDGSTLASGLYLYRLRADEKTLTRKMVLVK